jgi:aryl-alcohol dehydrogenase-like predicted oxidoreductase
LEVRTRAEQLDDNLAAADLALEDDEIARPPASRLRERTRRNPQA